MRYLTLLITLPLTLFILLFVVSNTERIPVSFYPGSEGSDWAVYMIALFMLALGFVAGALIVFIYAQRTRLRLWQESRRAARLEKELDLLQQKTPPIITPAEKPPADPLKKLA